MSTSASETWTTQLSRPGKPNLVHSYFGAVEGFAPKLLPRLEEVIRHQRYTRRVRKQPYALEGWTDDGALGYESAPQAVQRAARLIMASSPTGRILLNMAVGKGLDTALEQQEGLASAAEEPHIEPPQFRDQQSVQWQHGPVFDTALPGPDNFNFLWNIYGIAKLGARYYDRPGHLTEQSVTYGVGTIVVMSSDVEHWVSPVLDEAGNPDPDGRRGLIFFGYDHRLERAHG